MVFHPCGIGASSILELAIIRCVFNEGRLAQVDKLTYTTCVIQTFVPSPKRQLEPFDVDSITEISEMHTPAVIEHGQDTTSEQSTD